MVKWSASGLFEVWGGMVVEGDMCTPTYVRMQRLDVFQTSEAIQDATESGYEHFEYLEVRPPKAYAQRMAKLESIKRMRMIQEDRDNAPF